MKNIKNILFIFLFIFFGLLFYFQEDKKTEIEQISKKELNISNKNDYENSTFSEKKTIETVEKEEVNKKQTEIENIKRIEKSEKTVLKSINSNDNKYLIKLISKKKLKNLDKNSKIIMITGVITDGYNKSTFPMSLDESYIKEASFLSFEIKDKKMI